MCELWEGFSGLLTALLVVFVWMALKAFRELDDKKEQSKTVGERSDEDVKKDACSDARARDQTQ